MGHGQGREAHQFFASRVEELIRYAQAQFGGNGVAPNPLPHELRQVWRWFVDLNETRQFVQAKDMLRALRIDRRELFYWAATRDVKIESWQLAALEMMDEVYVRSANGERSQVISVPLTSQLFQTIFGK